MTFNKNNDKLTVIMVYLYKHYVDIYKVFLFFLMLLVCFSPASASDGKIDVNDILFFIKVQNSTISDKYYQDICDFNWDGVVDFKDYSIIISAVGAKKGDIKYVKQYDIYPQPKAIKPHPKNKKPPVKTTAEIPDTKKSVVSSSNPEPVEIEPAIKKPVHQQKKTAHIEDITTQIKDEPEVSESAQDNLPIKMEGIFVKPEKFLEVKKILNEITYLDSNITFSEKDNLILISDIPNNIKKYKEIISFISSSDKTFYIDKSDFYTKYKQPESDYIDFGRWIFYNTNTNLVFKENYITAKQKIKYMFSFKNVPVSEYVKKMNDLLDINYSVSNNIADNSINVTSNYEVPYRDIKKIFLSSISICGYEIKGARIEIQRGLPNIDPNMHILIFRYEEILKNFKEDAKLLEGENLKFNVFPEIHTCLIFGLRNSIEELTGKWNKLKEVLLLEKIKKYTMKIRWPEIVYNKFMYYCSMDKIADAEALVNIKEVNNEIKGCPLTYNKSIIIGFPADIEDYVDNLFFQLDQIEDDQYEYTYVYRLTYNDAEEIAAFLLELYPSRDDDAVYIAASKKSNAIILKTKSKVKSNEIIKTIKDLDKKPLQVLIKVLIAEVNHDDADRFGFEWKIGDKYQQGGVEEGLRKADQSLTTPLTGLKYSLLKGSKYDMFFNAVTSNKAVNILSKPQIMTKNNTAAKIIIGKEVPVIKLTQSGENNANDEYSQPPGLESVQTVILRQNLANKPGIETEYKEVGIALEVTPHINESKTIMLDIKQTVSEVESTALLENPVIKKREATTSVIIKNNHTVAIGGMIKKDKTENIKKVPVLSNLPIIGKALFSSKEENEVNSELIIFITPSIVTDYVTAKIKTNYINKMIDDSK